MDNLRGAALMVASMAGFSLEDMFIKTLTSDLAVAQVLMTLGIGGAIAFALLTLMSRGTLAPLVHRDMFSRAVMVRNFGEGGATIFFITSLSLVPLSTVAAVFQATPLAITAGAALFLGERVGWRRWTAIAVGFLGVLIIIRPGASGFDLTALLPLVAVLGIVFRDLVTRQLKPGISSMAIGFYGFVSVFVAGCLLSVFDDPLQWPTPGQWLWFLGAVIFGTGGYYAIVQAMRVADTSAVMPFRYTRLIFSLIIGMTVFGERPDAMTLIGATIIIGTGLYMFMRESRMAAA